MEAIIQIIRIDALKNIIKSKHSLKSLKTTVESNTH